MLESQRAHACSLRHQASCLSNLVGQVVHEKLSYVNLAGWFPDRFPRKCFRGLVVQTLSVSKLVLQSWCEDRHDIFTANLLCKWVGRLCFVTLQEVRFKVATPSLS
ncbi:hypothetical protein AVEN_233413-1 [Araneus ventricosus]|uniref:Uncharacterized protein n=1 Tax=Araneus ventricosus TaxID=182803 RepID=A0A4Y2WW00_ARAVE|nr:hypothetical protein AVEN_233413-1 [Araneus ventricosus]